MYVKVIVGRETLPMISSTIVTKCRNYYTAGNNLHIIAPPASLYAGIRLNHKLVWNFWTIHKHISWLYICWNVIVLILTSFQLIGSPFHALRIEYKILLSIFTVIDPPEVSGWIIGVGPLGNSSTASWSSESRGRTVGASYIGRRDFLFSLPLYLFHIFALLYLRPSSESLFYFH